MADDPKLFSGAEEYISIKIELAEPLDPDAEKNLRATIKHMDAVAFDSCEIAPGKISCCYDPTRTNKKALLEAIRQAGGKLKHIESEASPLL